MAEIKGITAEMTKTVDKLLATNFENATPEEIEAYAEWTRIFAMNDELVKQKQKIREQESARKLELFEQQAQSAMNALDALAELAQAKLKVVENGL